MEKQEFIANALSIYYGKKPDYSIPDDWVREAWQLNLDFREDVTAALARSIQKTGSLELAEEWISNVGPAISGEQAISLYVDLKSNVDRCESEWRDEFESAFQSCSGELPPIDRDRLLYFSKISLFGAIHRGEIDELKRVVSEFQRDGFQLNDAKMSTIEILENYVMFNCFGEENGEQIWSALGIAQAEQLIEIERILRDAGATE